MAIDKRYACAVSVQIPRGEFEEFELRSFLYTRISFARRIGFRDFIVGVQHEKDMYIAMKVLRLIDNYKKNNPDWESVRVIVALPWRKAMDNWPEYRKNMHKHIMSFADEICFISGESGQAAWWMIKNAGALITDADNGGSDSLASETLEFARSLIAYWVNPDFSDFAL